MIEAKSWDVRSDGPIYEAILFGLEGKLIFDIGANGGRYTRRWAWSFDRVVALEPHPASYAALVNDCKDNVTALRLAASDVNGDIWLQTSPEHEETGQYVTGQHLDWSESDGNVPVTAVTLDWLANTYGPPDVVKIDVEGHEARVLSGAATLLESRHPRCLIEIHSQDLGHACWDRLYCAGYAIRRIDHEYLEGDPKYDEHFYLDAVPA